MFFAQICCIVIHIICTIQNKEYSFLLDNKVTYFEMARRQSVIRDVRYVVIIDDQSTGSAILEKIVSQIADNIKVVTFNKPVSAMMWLDNNNADLIITDYMMPIMNGIDVVNEVRSKSHCEYVPIIMISVVKEKAVRYDALEAGATAFLMRPIDPIECRTSCRNLLKLYEQHLIIQDRSDWLARQVEVATKKIIQREKETIFHLAKAGEYRDKDTGNHVIRMAKYSRLIAKATGKLTEQECDDLEYAALMHDIGKIGIPDYVLHNPERLNPEEREVMRQHTEIGYNILSRSQSKYMKMGAIIALNHHEHFNGQGYPKGLKGDEIPLIAKIVAVADVFDALVSSRSYKSGWTTESTLNYIKQQSGKQLDPECVHAFFDEIDGIKEIQVQYAD